MYSDDIIDVVDYYIIFVNTDYRNVFLKRLKQGFQHVIAVKKSCGGKFWIVTNPMQNYTLIDIIPIRDYPNVRDLILHPDATVVEYRAFIKDRKRHRVHFMSCVEITKSLLGIRAAWVVTPWQLYKYLTGGNRHGRQRKSFSESVFVSTGESVEDQQT